MTDAGVLAPIHKNLKTTLPRINNFYSSTKFTDRNLLGKLYPETSAVTLSYAPLPVNTEGSWEDYAFDEILTFDFQPAVDGDSYGPTWTTHWFKVDFTMPQSWATEAQIRFRWNSGTEATLWDVDGKVLQGLSASSTQSRTEYKLAHSTEPQTLYVEAVASRMFGAGTSDQIDPTNPNFTFTVATAELVIMDETIYKLTRDLEVLYQLADELLEDQRGYMAMHTANQMINDILNNDTAAASALADAYFAKGNGVRAHTLAAIGNCHIDTAWLWPYSETKRKVARSFSSQLKLMEDYPDFKFVASQAQQWAWCEESFNELFTRISAKVATGEFLPVGTTWVEMDGNIPSGESFIRQFYYGYKFYKEKFNYVCNEFWLPDTFGYSAQIPAMMKHVNLDRFLTQKMSWSLVNKFPHHNFLWEGIDGSTVLAHFPPGDSYSMYMNVEELKRTEDNLRDKGRVSTSAFLYGYGDGGGGPTEDMIERGIRLADVDGCPKLTFTTPDELFTQLDSERANLMKWTGELYLELHNGTYTSQADMKRLCREAEFRLRDAEFLYSCSMISSVAPTGVLVTLEAAWKKVLLNQFHDVLPGSSIEIVYPEASGLYDEAIASADTVYDDSSIALFGGSSVTNEVLMNTLQWPRREVVGIESSIVMKNKKLQGKNRQMGRATSLYFMEAPAFGYGQLSADATPDYPCTYEFAVPNHVLNNGLVRAVISPEGQIISLTVPSDTKNRDLLLRDSEQKYGNKVTLYDDEPLYWDAWDIMDYHLETAEVLNDTGSTNITSPVALVLSGTYEVRLTWSMTVGEASTLTQEIAIQADTPYIIFETTVDWQESHRLLKVGFDTNLLARNASFDIQFGHIQRATHMNTSWDTARYEVCGHKWADLSEPDFGMAVLNDSKYGWSARGNSLSLTLLKAPKAPDDTCDIKEHTFKYAVMPHTGTLQSAEVMRRGYEFNNPLRLTNVDETFVTSNPTWSLMSVEGDGIIIHTIKPEEESAAAEPADIILRMFECDGKTSSSTIVIQNTATNVVECNGLEETSETVDFTAVDGVTRIDVTLFPFKIYAIKISFQSAKKK